MSLRSEALVIQSRLKLHYVRPAQVSVRHTLTAAQCYELSRWRKIAPLQEFSESWNQRPGARP